MAAERVTQEVKEVSEDINVVALVKGEERYIFFVRRRQPRPSVANVRQIRLQA